MLSSGLGRAEGRVFLLHHLPHGGELERLLRRWRRLLLLVLLVELLEVLEELGVGVVLGQGGAFEPPDPDLSGAVLPPDQVLVAVVVEVPHRPQAPVVPGGAVPTKLNVAWLVRPSVLDTPLSLAGLRPPDTGTVGPGSAFDVYAKNTCPEHGALTAALGDQTSHVVNTDRATWAFEAPPAERMVAATLDCPLPPGFAELDPKSWGR